MLQTGKWIITNLLSEKNQKDSHKVFLNCKNLLLYIRQEGKYVWEEGNGAFCSLDVYKSDCSNHFSKI